MPEEQLPAWLSAALLDVANDLRDADLGEDEPIEVFPGDVCVVHAMNGRPSSGRLLVVTDVEDGCCRGMLAGIETELATEVDAVLSPSLTRLGYEVAVYTRFSGAVWITQIGRRVGAVVGDVLDQLLALAWSDEPNGVVLTCGVPLQPAGIDPRYPALARMSAELDQLTDHCHRERTPRASARIWTGRLYESGILGMFRLFSVQFRRHIASRTGARRRLVLGGNELWGGRRGS